MDGGGRKLHALTGTRKGDGFTHVGVEAMQARVLPKWLRRPTRMSSRIIAGEVALPKYLEAALLGGFIGFCVIYGAAIGGQLQDVSERTAIAMGFGITQIEVSGNTHTQVEDVYRALEIDEGRSLVGLNAVDARDAIIALPWVEEAHLRKVYPDTLAVSVSERIPFALWQMGDAVTVVEQDGSPIGPFAADPRIAALPLVVGTGAADRAEALFADLDAVAWLRGQIHAAIRVGDRRWDLRLRNGMTIKLPEHDIMPAIARLEFLDQTHGVLARDLAAIDLRYDDRTIFALTENATAARSVYVEERAKKNAELKSRGSI